MKRKLKHFWWVLKQTFFEFNKDKASIMAAAQAYFTVFALPPMLLLLGMMLGVFLDGVLIQQQIKAQAHIIGGDAAVNAVQTIFENLHQAEHQGLLAGLVSFGVLLFSATNLFTQLQDSLDTIWGVEVKPDAGIKRTLLNRLIGFALILGLGALVVLSMASDLVLALAQNFIADRLGLIQYVVLFKALSFGISFGLLTLAFAITFSFLPDLKIKLRDVLAGALFTSLLFSLSRIGLSLYLTHSDLGSAYGTAGSLMVFLFFIFISMQLFFLGAEFTEVYARSQGDAFVPDKHAQWLPGRPRETELMRSPETETARREKAGEREKVRTGR